jgi:amino acid transporter
VLTNGGAGLKACATPVAGRAGLRRELGRWDLTGIGVNQVIGSALFVQPAAVAALLGAWSPMMFLLVGLACLLIALCFAELGSRFEVTGGPYIYTRAAFGRFAGFQVGWLMWFTRTASWAAVVNVLVVSLGRYWPALTSGWRRSLVITLIILVIAAINVRGIRQSSTVVNVLTIGKLLPLAIFIAVGFFAIEPTLLVPADRPSPSAISAAALLLIFAFGGYEVVPVPAGESRDARRAVPFALVATLVIVTIVMTLTQVVALGTFPGLSSSATPLAAAAATFLGTPGALLMTIAAVVSTTGNSMGQAIAGPRSLFALAEQGDLPAVFARVHPTFRTPVVAIAVTAAVAVVLATSGTFVRLALVSGVTRLVIYVCTCAATLRLRRPEFGSVVAAAMFVVPFGAAIPAIAIAVSLAILAGLGLEQLLAAAITVLAGAILYAVAPSIHREDQPT